eukprot:Unigene16240_Nuclearia_a/m.48201 Unigene16240_Nuclearia_a/g.48201  ORF Unigene16240_Nuclearia_a/g.48201 Unigene16240_Nuclearia_a/m.48201 type:complete len:318 (-) Unigene16240_Nuclearia_a:2532-3485(-)
MGVAPSTRDTSSISSLSSCATAARRCCCDVSSCTRTRSSSLSARRRRSSAAVLAPSWLRAPSADCALRCCCVNLCDSESTCPCSCSTRRWYASHALARRSAAAVRSVSSIVSDSTSDSSEAGADADDADNSASSSCACVRRACSCSTCTSSRCWTCSWLILSSSARFSTLSALMRSAIDASRLSLALPTNSRPESAGTASVRPDVGAAPASGLSSRCSESSRASWSTTSCVRRTARSFSASFCELSAASSVLLASRRSHSCCSRVVRSRSMVSCVRSSSVSVSAAARRVCMSCMARPVCAACSCSRASSSVTATSLS